MKLKLRSKPVLDEREMQEMYRIEHAGFWGMYALLCAVIIVQILMGAEAVQLAGEVITVALVSVALIIAYARGGIWDAGARPSRRGNAVYAAVSAVCVALIVLVMRGRAVPAILSGVVMLAACYALLTLMMHVVARRQAEKARELDDE